jgi:hypothetical protein
MRKWLRKKIGSGIAMLLHIRVVRRIRVRERIRYRLIDLHRLSLGASLVEDVISDGHPDARRLAQGYGVRRTLAV